MGNPPRRGPALLAAVALAAVVAGLAWTAWQAGLATRFDGRGGISSRLRIRRDVPPEGRFPGDGYAGSRACAGCHPGEYALYTGSGHALTFRAATPGEGRLLKRLDGRSVADPEIPDVRWTFRNLGGKFQAEREAEGKVRRFVIDYVLGSGHHATTFVSVLSLDPLRIIEHRLTHFTSDDSLGITPGQERHLHKPGNTAIGCEMDTPGSLKCLGCHATELSGRDDMAFDPATLIPGVSCERCHGPGRAHIDAARKDPNLEDMMLAQTSSRWEGRRQLEFCGRCHRHPDRVPPERLNPDDPVLARFQPIGISQSRCYKESSGGMSCLTCHDPHARSSSDPTSYEPACLNCHATNANRETHPIGVGTLKSAALSCPVSPSAGCLSCHMPKVDAGQHVLFTDHWIRVHRTARPPSED